MSLITNYEVLSGSSASFDYPTHTFCMLIPQYEQALTRECLGQDLYDFMVSKLTPYPEVVTEWDSSAVYSEGDMVVRNYVTYESTADSNDTDPLTAGSDWALFVKFTHAGANELWNGYLKSIIAMRVYNASLPLTTYRSGAGGMVVNSGDSSGFRSANKAEMLTANMHHEGLIQLYTTNMVQWLKDNYVAKELPAPSCAIGCKTIGRRSRRWAFR